MDERHALFGIWQLQSTAFLAIKMKSMYKFSIYLSTGLLILLFGQPKTVFGQERTGNIVEYFGKEKIDDISEGSLVHIFDEGLVLEVNRLGDRSETFPGHPVFKEFLYHPGKTVEENELFGVNYLGEEMRWMALTTDSTHTFSDRILRNGYLYLEYESPRDEVLLFEGSGHTQVLINGLPQEGDHYDFGWNLIPVQIQKGTNTFILTPGRFPRMRARLIRPSSPVMLTSRDLLIPDLLIEEPDQPYTGAIRLINSSGTPARNFTIHSRLNGMVSTSNIRNIARFQVQKVPFKIPFHPQLAEGEIEMVVELQDGKGQVVSTVVTTLQVRSNTKHHKRTFISQIDNSVQYFSVAPSTHPDQDSQALFLSVHGASVEAVNQANAYDKKDWGYLVAPTNRRPFGFAWEDWGRLDALEVLAEAKRIYQPHPQKIYLTGHSMGGHGTWYLGATYPGLFAAIAPCAGYPDLLEYRNSFIRRQLESSPESLARWGLSPKTIERMLLDPVYTPVEKLIRRAGNPSRTLKLIRNYLQVGVYILHGEKDNVVPTFLARDMRERLGTFHPDFVYYEYPNGTHWYGDHSVDWPPIFEFFKRRTIPLSDKIDEFEFYTASPGISSTSHFATIQQQEQFWEISHINVVRGDSLRLTTSNVELLHIEIDALGDLPRGWVADGQVLHISDPKDDVYLRKTNGTWQLTDPISKDEKGPHRYGGFKDAFNNGVVLVYATGGSAEENTWYFNRASFDANKFWYRANGSITVIRDVDFNPAMYKDRNVVLYGNKDNNQAWSTLLAECPVQVSDGKIEIGDVSVQGAQWGTYFIYPRPDSEVASVGVVSATGSPGMKAAYDNHYLENGTTFPDFLLFDKTVFTEGNKAVKCAGFFGNDWSVKAGDFEWK